MTKLVAKFTVQPLTHQIQSILKNESVGTCNMIQYKEMYKLLTVPVETLLEAPEPKANTDDEQHEVM
jgi:hypothetical protein